MEVRTVTSLCSASESLAAIMQQWHQERTSLFALLFITPNALTWAEFKESEGGVEMLGCRQVKEDLSTNWDGRTEQYFELAAFNYRTEVFFFFYFFFIGVQLINNVVIVSGEQGRDSAIQIHVSILPQSPLPSWLPGNSEQSSLCGTTGPCWWPISKIATCTWPFQSP